MNRKVPTYLLDDNYYLLVDQLAINTEMKINHAFSGIIKNYTNYLERNNIESLRSQAEYGLELLYIGVLYVSYSKDDGTIYNQLDNLCNWLESTKEFDEIVVRFRLWLSYWSIHDTIVKNFRSISEVAIEFLNESSSILYQYTKQVPEFIQKAEHLYKDREDYVFITRHVNEYYINMVGAQILNRVFREEFNRVDNVFVFVPGCMAAQLENCRAVAGKIGYICSQCTDTCPINVTRELSETYHANTVIVYHSSELYRTKVQSNDKKGVIGITCVLNLIAGGLKAKELGYVPQCVLLDYCGCKQHWDNDGLITDINKDRLEQILQFNNIK